MSHEQEHDKARLPAADALALAQPGPRGAPMKPRVLIVDTDRGAPLLAKLLGDGFDIAAATTWDDAVRLLQEGLPQIVLVGYHFDQTRPYRFIGHLREQRPSAELPVLLVRGTAVQHGPYMDELVQQSYRSFGANAYLAVDKSSTGIAGAQEAERLRQTVIELLSEG